jgi:hypothetical protein
MRWWAVGLCLVIIVGGGCSHVRPWERGRLASPAMQFEYDAYAAGQESSIVEITEGGTFAGNGPGGAGAGCGCH